MGRTEGRGMKQETLAPVGDVLYPATLHHSKVYDVPYTVVGDFTDPRLRSVRGENFLLDFYCRKCDYPHLSLALDISHFFDIHDIQDWSADRSYNRPRAIISLARRASFRTRSKFKFVMFKEKETRDYLYDTIFSGIDNILAAYGKKYHRPQYEWRRDNFADEFTSYLMTLGAWDKKPHLRSQGLTDPVQGIFMTHAVRVQRGLEAY